MKRPVTFVNVNKQVIARNGKTGAEDPPIRVSRGKYGKAWYVSTFKAQGRILVVYDSAHPLPCGAKVWLEIEETK